MTNHLEYIEPNQKILDKILSEFTEATGLATILVDTQGIELTAGYGFSPFCQLMRNNEDTRKLCQNCDMFGGRSSIKNKRTTPYVCHAGLVDFSYPVKIGEQIIGYILCGQTKIASPHNFQPIIKEKTEWSDNPLLVEAYKNMPTTTPEKIRAGSELLTIIINYYLSDIMGKHIAVQFPEPIPRAFVDEEVTKHPAKQQPTIVQAETTPPIGLVELPQTELPKNCHSEIEEAIDYINKHLNEAITLNEVANHVYLSEYYLSKLFKKELGINFIDYINEKKINRAMILLQDSTWSIDSIAYSLGFSQASYFSKIFKKVAKVTPSQYRNQIQKEAYRK